MCLFIILLIIALILMVVTTLIISVVGAAGIFVFGDVIVCIVIIIRIAIPFKKSQ